MPDGDVHFKITHIGTVQIDDDVEIGVNNAIDRGSFGKTHICRGVKTGNLVHVAHNLWMRVQGVLRHLPFLKKKIDTIERRLNSIDEDK